MTATYIAAQHETHTDAERALYKAAVDRPMDPGHYALIRLVEAEHSGTAAQYAVEAVLEDAASRRDIARMVAHYEADGSRVALGIADSNRPDIAALDAAYGYTPAGE